MGCWGLVVYAATAAVCSGKKTKNKHSFHFYTYMLVNFYIQKVNFTVISYEKTHFWPLFNTKI